MCEKCRELQADLDHCRAMDWAAARGAADFLDRKPLADNPFPEDWDAKPGTVEWRRHLQHGVWDDAWRREQEIELLQEIALAAKVWARVPVPLDTLAAEELRSAVEAYEQSGIALPEGWPGKRSTG